MITEINLENFACYKSRTRIALAKRNTLIYGLNGSGKSTISNFLYDPTDNDFSSCSLLKSQDLEILVYNQKFVEDYFYEDGELPGVFTLSKENKEIKIEIGELETELSKKGIQKEDYLAELKKSQERYHAVRNNTIKEAWKIKTTYTGGDRVLEFCIRGLMKKEKLYEHLRGISLSEEFQSISIESLKQRASVLSDESATEQKALDEISIKGLTIDETDLLKNEIRAKTEGPVGEFIEKLGNSNWVSEGLSFVQENGDEPSVCPFCQERTLSKALIESIRSIFDGDYKDLKLQLSEILKAQESQIQNLDLDAIVDECKYISQDDLELWKSTSQHLVALLNGNLKSIQDKILNPQKSIAIEDVSSASETLNKIIRKINSEIKAFNQSIANRKQSIDKVRSDFWEQMRSDHAPYIKADEDAETAFLKEKQALDSKIKQTDNEITAIQTKLVRLRKKTINIDASVDAINNRLNDLGVTGFKIEKHGDSMYQLARDSHSRNVFRSLSEGEKTLISFLYFIERCNGTLDPTKSTTAKSVVIDDPISSLSHIYVFNIGQYIKREFVNNPSYSQIIVLTHSLYFFYELTFTKREDRDQQQELMRLVKSSNGSEIKRMRYEEIQNDYQTYWATIKDTTQQPALIANCMRNIIEHFFAFVRKRDYNNVFQLPELSEDRFKSFNRYMNRESHSLGQNIFDIKEFDYSHFIEGMKLVFEKTGYVDHYKAMMK